MDEQRVYVTRFRYYNWADLGQGAIRGMCIASCWPDNVNESGPKKLAGQFGYFYTCKCTQEQYSRFTEIVSRYFDTNSIDFDYKMDD